MGRGERATDWTPNAAARHRPAAAPSHTALRVRTGATGNRRALRRAVPLSARARRSKRQPGPGRLRNGRIELRSTSRFGRSGGFGGVRSSDRAARPLRREDGRVPAVRGAGRGPRDRGHMDVGTARLVGRAATSVTPWPVNKATQRFDGVNPVDGSSMVTFGQARAVVQGRWLWGPGLLGRRSPPGQAPPWPGRGPRWRSIRPRKPPPARRRPDSGLHASDPGGNGLWGGTGLGGRSVVVAVGPSTRARHNLPWTSTPATGRSCSSAHRAQREQRWSDTWLLRHD